MKRPQTLIRAAGWLALVAMLALSSPGVRLASDAGPAEVAVQETPAVR